MSAARGPISLLGRMPVGLRRRVLFLVVANLLLLGLIAWQTRGREGAFLRELASAMRNVAPMTIAGLGLTGLIVAGGMDLSIGAIVGVAGTVFGVLHRFGMSPAVCFAGCFATALALSTWNGLLVRWLKLPAIIVTLAGLAFYRGVALILADVATKGSGEQFTLHGAAYHAPGEQYAGAILFATLAVALLWEQVGKTPRMWLARGGSESACRLAGLDPDRILMIAWIAGGVFLGIAALLDVTNRLTIEPARLGLEFELTVIAAVVLGGTSIFGGVGSYLGTALGALFLYLIAPAMLFAGVSVYWRTAVQGAVILAVIGVDCALGRRRKRMEELR